jgi:hypothetical protein
MFGDFIMLRTFSPLAALALLALVGLPAAAQPTPNGPTPNEQVGIHTGTTTTNGSAVIVQDQNGTHPEGYPGMAPRNRVSGDSGTTRGHHHHRRHHMTDVPPPG